MLVYFKRAAAWLLGLPFRLFALLLGVKKQCRACAVYSPEQIPDNVRYCLVPGAMIHADNKLTPMLTRRMEAVAELAKRRPDMSFILSGNGSGTNYSDVAAMYRYLRDKHSICEGQLILDGKGFTTLDSVRNLPEEVTRQRFLLLTGAFHMPRCVYICQKLGLQPYAYMLPEQRSKYDYRYRLREHAALVKAWYILNFR